MEFFVRVDGFQGITSNFRNKRTFGGDTEFLRNSQKRFKGPY